jgi:hypothetical protein
MRTLKALQLILALSVCGLLEAATYKALVVSVSGTAFEVDGNEAVVRTLAPNAQVEQGNGIRTGDNASLTILLANGAVLDIEPGCLVYLEQLQINGDPSLIVHKPLTPSPADTQTRLRVERGRVLGEVKGLSSRSKFELASAVGTAGITGTKFIVEVISLGDNRFSMAITNLDGSVTRTEGTGPTTPVSAGEQTVITAVYDSETGELSDIEVISDTLPSDVIDTLVEEVGTKVETAVDEAENTDGPPPPVIIIPINVDPEVDDPQQVVTGTPT